MVIGIPTGDPDRDRISLWKACKRDPLVPMGCCLTAGILVTGLISFRNGNAALSQKLMRARIGAQFLTVGLVVLSSVIVQRNRDKVNRQLNGADQDAFRKQHFPTAPSQPPKQ
eukprot:TRINITY_DN13944_c0_g1_i1.p2 TRINITY_DN13944_c0_g1~~TRINITY_DN13944_c0_g1_i1.p2  ORF type:complete len:113 (-),score=16.81 TRINITY_DN13944_c0_g1_i1:212-550(-)